MRPIVARLTTVIALLLLTVPLATSAQRAGKVYHVGLLGSREGSTATAFRQGLQDRGYSEGRNITITSRWSEGNDDRFPTLAAELVRLRVDVIVAIADQAAVATKAATRTIPIVFIAGDPVAIGLASSLAHPGGNLTGFAVIAEGISAKQLELLKEMLPRATRVAVLTDPSLWQLHYYLRDTVAAADKLNLRLQILKASTAQEIDRAFEAAGEGHADAMQVYGQPLFARNRAQIVALAKSRRIPTMFLFQDFVTAGGLMSYGPNASDIGRRMAGHVDKILKGARPTDLPVEQPTKYDLVINLKTAKALGLTIPSSLLLRADRVIE